MKLKDLLVTILSASIVLAFCLNYPIAEYLAPWDIDPDKNLAIRFNIYALILLGCFFMAQTKQNKWSSFCLNVGIALSLSDVVDRFLFDVKTFEWNDLLMIGLALIFAYRKHIHIKKIE